MENQSRKKHVNIACVICVIFILATLAFIWGNSMQTVEVSGERSEVVLEQVKPVSEAITGSDNLTIHILRKLAHLIEYSALGMEFALLLAALGSIGVQNVVNCAFAGFSVAVIDETIQIFTNRGSQVQDVWLDFAGLCAGLFAVLAVLTLVSFIRRKYTRNNAA